MYLKAISIWSFVLILIGCSNSGMVKNNEQEITDFKTEIYTVRSVDWLFGNQAVLEKDGKDLIYINLHDTNFRSEIDEGKKVEVTKINYRKNGNEWGVEEYKLLD